MHLNDQIAKVRLSRVFYWLGIFALIVFVLTYFRSFLQPFVIAFLAWFLIKDLTGLIGKLKFGTRAFPGWLRRIVAFGTIVMLVFFIVDILINNIELIIEKLPEYEQKLNQLVGDVGHMTGVEDISGRLKQRLEALNFRSFLSEVVGTLSSFLGNMFIIIIYLIFLLIEEATFSRKMQAIFQNAGHLNEIRQLSERIGGSINAYLSVKTVISVITGLLSYVILLMFRVDFPELWGFLIFLLNFIPYIGSFIATLLPAVFAVFQFNSFICFVWVFGAVELVQILMGNYVEPRVMGKTLNLSPLIVLLSLSFWGMIWGPIGMLLSVPITSIVLIILMQFDNTRNLARLMSENGDIEKAVVEKQA